MQVVTPADPDHATAADAVWGVIPPALHIEDLTIQHRRLEQLADEVAETLKGDPEPARVGKAVYRLLDYLQLHFADEEQFMASIGYPVECFRAHTARHEAFLQDAQAWYERISAGDLSDARIEVARIAKWQVEHSLGDDQACIDFAMHHFGQRQTFCS